jgi:anti-anti-sigma factor
MSSALASTKLAIIEPEKYLSAINASELLDKLTEIVSSAENSIVLVDMHQVEFLDSAGLMSLVTAFRLANTLGKRFSLCSVVPAVRMVFELTQLDTVFEMFENRNAFEMELN